MNKNKLSKMKLTDLIKEEEYKLDNTFVKKVKKALGVVWQIIAQDLYDTEKHGEKLTNDSAIESVIDNMQNVDLWQSAGHNKKEIQDVYKIIDKAMDKFGYQKVIKFLSKNIRFV